MKYFFIASFLDTFETQYDANRMKNTGGLLKLLEFYNLAQVANLTHFVTTRAGGVSLPPYNSLNLGLHTADYQEHVYINRSLLAERTGIPKDKFLFASQVHSGDVKIIDAASIANGVNNFIPRTDATITALPGICLIVMVADCVPVLLFDPVKKVSAVIHAGWRGTVKYISSNAVKAMVEHFGSDPADIIAGIGPSIGPCCYEVGDEVKKVIEDNFGTTEGYLVYKNTSSKPHFDLWYANHEQLTREGIKTENIEVSRLCTKCHSGLFFSSRASKGITGRFAAGIYMVPDKD